MASLTLDLDATTAGAETIATDDLGGTWSFEPPVSRRLPPLTSKSQTYYWTRRWQEDERESLDALAAGETREFPDPDAAIRWLLSDDD